MPFCTHLLGPTVDSGVGKYQTQLMRRLSVTRDLIDQLPSFAHFKQIIDPSVENGLAIADGLAFQDRAYRVSPQYTFRLDCRKNLEDIWAGMHFKARQHIRRAEERHCVTECGEPDEFVTYYDSTVKKLGRTNRIDFSSFARLYLECKARTSGEILKAVNKNNVPVAMVFLAWGHGVMYYLLSTRDPELADSGAVSLLLWSAIKRAQERKLDFDFDGVYTSGTARFLSAFGGEIRVRLVVTRAQVAYRALQLAKLQVQQGDGNENFT
jgi:hypothetical protein